MCTLSPIDSPRCISVTVLKGRVSDYESALHCLCLREEKTKERAEVERNVCLVSTHTVASTRDFYRGGVTLCLSLAALRLRVRSS